MGYEVARVGGEQERDPGARAAFRFGLVCRLVGSDRVVARRLSDYPGRTVSRQSVMRWRRNLTAVPGWAMVAVEELAGVVVALQLPTRPP
jgi:hypothetical protein